MLCKEAITFYAENHKKPIKKQSYWLLIPVVHTIATVLWRVELRLFFCVLDVNDENETQLIERQDFCTLSSLTVLIGCYSQAGKPVYCADGENLL